METKIEEIWKDVVGYEGSFKISNLGNLRSVDRPIKSIRYNKPYLRIEKGRAMIQQTNSNGYLCVSLTRGRKKMIHRLVAIAFIENPLNKPDVNHKDTNKKNNVSSNLEWVTKSENTIHAIKAGVFPIRTGSDHPKSKRIIDITSNVFYDNLRQASISTGIGYANLSVMLTGKKGRKNKTNLRYV